MRGPVSCSLTMLPTDPPTLERYAAVIRSFPVRQPPPQVHALRTVQQGFAAYYHHVVTADAALPAAAPPSQAGPGDVAPLAAADGEAVVTRVWQAVNRLFERNGAAADPIVDHLVAAQLPSGSLLQATAADSPDLHWYHELILLHALGVYAVHTARADVWSVVARSAAFHLEETQPDHATSEPWGLFAFLCFAETIPLADQLLHTLQTQQREAVGPITWMLLGDTLYCLRRQMEQTTS